MLFQIDKQQLLKNIANNLGITDISESSQLKVLLDGLHDTIETVLEDMSKTVANNYLETCDANSLQKYGLQNQLPRYLKSRLTINSGDQAIALVVQPNNVFKDGLLKLLSKDDVIELNSTAVLKINEDVLVDLSKNSSTTVFIGGVLSSYNELTPIDVPAGTEILVKARDTVSKYVKEFNIIFTSQIASSFIEENIEQYRSRLLRYLNIPKYSTREAIEALVSTYPYVDDYYIDNDTYPTNVYLFNNLMAESQLNDYLVDMYATAGLTQELNKVAAHGSYYKVSPAVRVDIKLLIISEDTVVDKFTSNMFKRYLLETRSLGTELLFDKAYLDTYLERYYSTTPTYDFKLYYHFDGFLLEEFSKEVLLKNNEFLQLTEVYQTEDSVSGTL